MFKNIILLIIINLISECRLSLISSIEDKSNNIYFQILEPESLRYTYKAKQAINFGKSFNQTLKLPLMIVEPNNACSSIINKLELRNNIGLVERGGCSFLDKCIEAERTGLKAILIFDNDNSNENKYIEMIADSTKRNCSISVAYMLSKDGHMIKNQMIYLGLEQIFINIPVNKEDV